jgi:hypothetical protein
MALLSQEFEALQVEDQHRRNTLNTMRIRTFLLLLARAAPSLNSLTFVEELQTVL